jgi:probable HAF family extracellular repeat protein
MNCLLGLNALRMLALASAALVSGAHAAEIIVTSAAGTLSGSPILGGKRTLPDAVKSANEMSGNVTIRFALKAGAVISLKVPLVVVAPKVVIDGQPAQPKTLGVTVVGPAGQDALTLTGAGDIVTNLAISSIVVRPSTATSPLALPLKGVVVSHCSIGVDATLSKSLNAHRDGLSVIDANGTLIVDNVIGGNQALNGGVNSNLAGIKIVGGSHSTVSGNDIGINPKGLAIANDIGILVQGSSSNLIGGTTGGVPCSGQCNLIDANTTNAIWIEGPASLANVISGNFVGVATDGVTAKPNGLARGLRNAPAIALSGEVGNTRIGGQSSGKCVGECNLISGNIASGIMISATTLPNLVVGNFVGVTADGLHALPNQLRGIEVENGASGAVVGGTRTGVACDGPCNLVSGNGDTGIWFTGAGTSNGTVAGNFIGTTLTGDGSLPNQGFGVRIDPGVSQIVVGGLRDATCDRDCNVISGNLVSGVGIVGPSGSGASFATVSGNVIGSDVKETLSVPNGVDGVYVTSGATNVVIGGEATPGPCQGACNHIAHNSGKGVVVTQMSNRIQITGNTIHANGSIDIDLDDNGITPNLAPSAVASPPRSNACVGFPMGVTSSYDGTNTTITGIVDAIHPEGYRVDVYAGQHARCFQPDAVTCYGSGELYLGKATVTPFGSFWLQVPGALPLPIVSATATDPTGSTSEYSPACSDRMANDGIFDHDNDGLCDDWERFGIDINGDGVVDQPLTESSGQQPSPTQPDLFVEVDYAPSAAATASDAVTLNSALGYVQQAFANAPALNSKVTQGVNLHYISGGNASGYANLDDILPSGMPPILVRSVAMPPEPDISMAALRTGDQAGIADPCAAAPGTAWYGTLGERGDPNCHFVLLAKRLFVHYVLVGPTFSGRDQGTGKISLVKSSGSENSYQDTFVAYDVVNQLAGKYPVRQVNAMAGTVMHEIGHLLHLCHGGPMPAIYPDCITAYNAFKGGQENINNKPNYLSVMNYSYQMYFDVNTNHLDYSRIALNTLNEASLSEPDGIVIPADAAANSLYTSKLQYFATVPSTGKRGFHNGPFGVPIDWDLNGSSTGMAVAAHIHTKSPDASTPYLSLEGATDWPSLRINFRDSPDFNSSAAPIAIAGLDEPTGDDAVAIRQASDADGDGIVDALDNCPLTPNPDQAATTGRAAGNACALAPATFAPVQMFGGATTTITLTKVMPAGVGGQTYRLRSDLATLVLPQTVTIPSGATSISFNVTAPLVSATINTTIDVLGEEDFGQIPLTITLNLSYAVTDIGTLGGSYSGALGINDSGQVVGTSYVSTDAVNSRPFIWNAGSIQELPSLPGQPGGAAVAISATGRVVGSVGTTSSMPAQWDGLALTQLKPLVAGGPGQATGVNASGDAVGAVDAFSAASVTHATLWSSGTVMDLGTLGPSSGGSNAVAINGLGTIAGSSDDMDGNLSAFVYAAGKMTGLPRPTWASICTAGAIDSAGNVYGTCRATGQPFHLVKWMGQAVSDLGTVPDSTSVTVTGASDSGQVVGWATTSSGLLPFLLSYGKVFDLNTLIGSSPQWHLDMAMGINAKGMIVGQGENLAGQTHGFLLVPQ